jgi:hypothetical protein
VSTNGMLGRLHRLELVAATTRCPAPHFRLVVGDALAPGPCPACGCPLDVLRIVIGTVPDRRREDLGDPGRTCELEHP